MCKSRTVPPLYVWRFCMRRKPVIGGSSEKAMHNLRSASQENCLNDVNHTGVCKYGLRWSLTQKYGCGNSSGNCRSFCCSGCLEVLHLLLVIAFPGQHRGKDAKRNLHSSAMRSTRLVKQVQFLYVTAAVNTQLLFLPMPQLEEERSPVKSEKTNRGPNWHP